MGLEQFEALVYSDLYAALQREFPPLGGRLDAATLERVMHETVLDARSELCFGRDAFVTQLQSFVLQRADAEHAGRAGVVWGKPGSGKSCVMARLYRELRHVLIGPDGTGTRGHVWVHVVSATAASFRVRDLLSRCADRIEAMTGLRIRRCLKEEPSKLCAAKTEVALLTESVVADFAAT